MQSFPQVIKNFGGEAVKTSQLAWRRRELLEISDWICARVVFRGGRTDGKDTGKIPEAQNPKEKS